MNQVTIKLIPENEQPVERALTKFYDNLNKLFQQNVEYEPGAVYDDQEPAVYLGVKLNDNALKTLIDASPGNSFEVIDTHWERFRQNKMAEGAETIHVSEQR